MRRKHKKRKPEPRQDKFPSLAERERIIQRRDELLKELIEIMIMHQGDSRRIDKLLRRYGAQEVYLVLDTFQKRAKRTELIGDETRVYREYRRAFARFGGSRSWLSVQEFSALSFEHVRLNAERTFKSSIRRKPGARERELRDLCLLDAASWDDITPPDAPPRPPDFNAPPPGEYDYPVQQLLKWGWDLDEERAKDNARNVSRWRPVTGHLVRMALDEGLLNGWPGERASWAPYHALSMLVYLGAYQFAGQLFPLFEQENDWLSDRLAVTWGQMGPQVAPPLWDYLDDSQRNPDWRSVVMLGLSKIAVAHPGRRLDIVTKFTHLLHQASADDTKANAYLVHVLNRLGAIEAADVIIAAFEQGKVDEKIFGPENLDILDWSNPDLYDRFYGQP
jgi:hypothetical protein